MTSMCVCVILKWFRWLWIGVSVGGSKSWWVLCRTHWGLGETFLTSTDEKGVAAGWRALKMRMFICSWMRPKYPWQELCCCYYCLISLSLGWISGSLPESGWNQPSLSYEFTGLSGSSRLCALSLQPNVQLNNITWKQRRKHGSSIFPFERRPDWLIPLCLAHSAASHGGGGKWCGNWYVLVVRGSLSNSHQACPALRIIHMPSAKCGKCSNVSLRKCAMQRWERNNWAPPLL